jgi:NADH:ubiquinone oxidoreductase subunit C
MRVRPDLTMLFRWLDKKFVMCYKRILPTLVKGVVWRFNEMHLVTNRSNSYPLMLFLKNHTDTQYKTLCDIIAYDVPGKFYRFAVVYTLLSTRYNRRIHVYVHTNEVLWLNSVSNLFNSAGWLEREVWDCYGIFFKNNNDLRRLLSDYGFQGFAFRKDFPLIGFVEVHYNEKDKLIRYDAIEVSAEYKNYRWNNAWL